MEKWDKEPDKLVGDYKGLKIAILRVGELGHLCGYVGIKKEHPWYGKEYDDVYVDVHGGLTYARVGVEGDILTGGYWWFGFDCAHSGDIIPSTYIRFGGSRWSEENYKDIHYVLDEVIKLADQILEIKKEGVDIPIS